MRNPPSGGFAYPTGTNDDRWMFHLQSLDQQKCIKCNFAHKKKVSVDVMLSLGFYTYIVFWFWSTSQPSSINFDGGILDKETKLLDPFEFKKIWCPILQATTDRLVLGIKVNGFLPATSRYWASSNFKVPAT